MSNYVKVTWRISMEQKEKLDKYYPKGQNKLVRKLLDAHFNTVEKIVKSKKKELRDARKSSQTSGAAGIDGTVL